MNADSITDLVRQLIWQHLRPTVKVATLPHAPSQATLAYETDGASGLDVRAAIGPKPWLVRPGERVLVPTGLICVVPRGFEIQVRPRSGLALRNGVTVLNSPGTIDADYRGETKLLIINHGRADFEIIEGMRLAQLVVAPVARARVQWVAGFRATARGPGGFGHTGVA